MTVSVFFSLLSPENAQTFLSIRLTALPSQMQEGLLRYADDQERARRLAGKLLLQEAVLQLLGPEAAKNVWEDIHRPPGKKPYFRTLPMHFSTAHSNGLSVVAVSKEGPVGIDAEAIKPLNGQQFTSWLHPAEKEKIAAASDPVLSFLKIWTSKEAVLKAAGTGIPDADLATLNTVENPVFHHGQWFRCQPLFLNDTYVAALVVPSLKALEWTVTELSF